MDKVIKALFRVLERTEMPYMIVGGIATSYYGFPRTTFDIDVVIQFKREALSRFTESALTEGFEFNPDEIETAAKIGNRFIMEFPRTIFRVDIWLAKTDYELAALERRSRQNILGEPIWIISGEDLILNKLLAGRPKDIDDAKGVLKRQMGKIDMEYLNHWANILNLEMDILDQ